MITSVEVDIWFRTVVNHNGVYCPLHLSTNLLYIYRFGATMQYVPMATVTTANI